MKIIEETIAKIVYIEWRDEEQCYLAALDHSILSPVVYGTSIQYERRGSIYIELASVDCSNIKVGDTITVRTVEHQPGEEIELFGGESYTFATGGIANIIIGIDEYDDSIPADIKGGRGIFLQPPYDATQIF